MKLYRYIRDRSIDRAAVVVSLWLLTTFSYAYIIVPTSVLPVIQETMLIGPLAASTLVSVTLAGQAFTNIPVGALLDRFDNVRITGWATLGLLAVAVWGWHASTAGAYWSLIVSRAFGGLVTVGMWTAGITITTSLYGIDRRATAVGFFTTSAPAGFALGQVSGPLLTGLFGWGGTFVVYGIAAVVVFGSVLLAVHRCNVPTTSHTDTPTPEQFRKTLFNRQVWKVSVLAFISFSAFLVLTNWMPSYLVDEFGYSLVDTGLFVAIFSAMGIASRWGGGAVSELWFSGHRRPVVLLSFVVATPAFAVLGVVRDPVLLVLVLALAGSSIQLGIGIFFSYARELVTPAVSGTAVSVTSAVAVLGATVGPTVTGALFEYTGSYESVFAYTVVLSFVGVVLARTAPEPDR